MTTHSSFRRRLAAVVLAGAATPVIAQPPTLPDAGIPASAVGLPPLVIPPPVVVPVKQLPVETPMAPPAAPAKPVVEAAKLIPSEPFPKPPADAGPRVTGPATTVRPATFREEAGSVMEVKLGTKATDAAAGYSSALVAARAALGSVRDYSCHLILRERVNGKLKTEQTAELHARTFPASVAVKVIAPAPLAGRELISVADRFAGKVRVKPANADSFVTVAVSDSRLTSDNRRGPAELGVAAVLDTLDRQMAVEKRLRNPVTVLSEPFEFAGRKVTRYEVMTERPHALRYAVRTVVFFDPTTKLPVRVEAYDGPAGRDLMESYSFINLKTNAGVPETVFDR